MCDQNKSVGYIVSTWPRLSQTFVLNEILALERLGLPLRIFSVKDPRNEPVHASVAQTRARVVYLSLRRHWKSILMANIRMSLGQPVRYARILMRALQYHRWGVLRGLWQAAYAADLLSREPVTHLHAHFATAPAMVAMFASELAGIPYSFTAHARDIYVHRQAQLLRTEMQRARAVVTVSEYNRQFLLASVSPASNGKVRCIYNGLDLKQFPFRWPRASDPGTPVMLSVSRLVEKKGLGDLIEAAGMLRERGRNFQVQIIGDGALRKALEAQVKRLGLQECVKLLGAQPQEMVRQAYLCAAVFALPCIISGDGDRDGTPTVLLEAMASGLPVVSTPVSGIPEMIDSGRNGLLVEPNHPSQLADALERLLLDANLRGRLAQAARQTVEERFTIERSSRELMAVFQAGGSQ